MIYIYIYIFDYPLWLDDIVILFLEHKLSEHYRSQYADS